MLLLAYRILRAGAQVPARKAVGGLEEVGGRRCRKGARTAAHTAAHDVLQRKHLADVDYTLLFSTGLSVEAVAMILLCCRDDAAIWPLPQQQDPYSTCTTGLQ
jgi:hypothetical protein